MNIREYILEYPEEVQSRLFELYEVIKSELPMAKEKISWGMPTFHYKENVIYFACHKHHIGIYPGADAIEHFDKELCNYKHSKGAIQFSHNKPMDFEFIRKICQYRLKVID